MVLLSKKYISLYYASTMPWYCCPKNTFLYIMLPPHQLFLHGLTHFQMDFWLAFIFSTSSRVSGSFDPRLSGRRRVSRPPITARLPMTKKGIAAMVTLGR